MRKLVFVFAVLFIMGLLCNSPVFAAEQKMLVEVNVISASNISTIRQMGIEIASERAVTSPVQVIVTPQQLQMLRARGWQTDILIDDIAERFTSEINADGALGAYHTYGEMLAEMQQVAATYPNIARLVDIGDTWEKTQGIADRDIWAIKISDNPAVEEPAEPDVLIVGCHHARELISVEIPLAIMRTLTTTYSHSAAAKYLVDNREIWIVPMVNPDGHEYVRYVDPMWRKNRNTNGSSSALYQGVDLNRNYGYMWGYDNIGSSPNTWDETYRGASAFSEPETQAIRDLSESHEFALCLSYHSYGDMFLFPWGYISADTSNHGDFVKLGQIFTAFNDYEYGNANSGLIYNTNGDTDDWMYGEQSTKNKVFGVTVEVGHWFHPAPTAIPGLIQENLRPALWMIYVSNWLTVTED